MAEKVFNLAFLLFLLKLLLMKMIAGFELGSSKWMASTLTTIPTPLPLYQHLCHYTYTSTTTYTPRSSITLCYQIESKSDCDT